MEKYVNGIEEIKVLHTDTTFVPNKRGKIKGRNRYYKSKNGLKISTLLDDNRVPICTIIKEGNIADCKLFGEFIKDENIKRIEIKKKKQAYITADKGYCCKKNREEAEKMGYKLLCPLKKNMKGKKMDKKEIEIYKRRVLVENYYGHIKIEAKITGIYERKKENYEGIVKLVNIKIISSKIGEI